MRPLVPWGSNATSKPRDPTLTEFMSTSEVYTHDEPVQIHAKIREESSMRPTMSLLLAGSAARWIQSAAPLADGAAAAADHVEPFQIEYCGWLTALRAQTATQRPLRAS